MIAIDSYEICYPNPLNLKLGDAIQIFEKDVPEKWRGWHWCKDSTGNEGWISETYFRREESTGKIIKDYTAKEISVDKGEDLDLVFKDNGWAWCKKTNGEEGWLPTEILVNVEYAKETLIKGFYEVLGEVAREKIHIEMIEPPEFNKVEEFQKKLIANNSPVFYATLDDDVIGWADISPASNPRLAHRGFLGMGVHKNYRGKGIGSRLLDNVLKHAKAVDLEKVELSVYTINKPGIALYEKFGFQRIGVIKNYRKLDGKYFDTVEMETFL